MNLKDQLNPSSQTLKIEEQKQQHPSKDDQRHLW